ncbi:MAG: MMPL family transporter [Planctomycetes bacterium]|nr:MMPL family transporter [Planctomycetota bacterium]
MASDHPTPRRNLARAAWLLLLLGAAACAIFATRRFRLESSAESLVLDGDPDLRFYQETRTLFASDEFVLCALEAEDHFTPAGVARLERLTKELEALPGIAQVLSPTRVPLFFSRREVPDEGRIASALRNRVPRTLLGDDIDLRRAKEELSTHRVYRYAVLSPDGRVAAALAFLAADPEHLALAQERTRLQGELERGVDGPRRAEIRARLASIDPRYLELEQRRQDQRFSIVASVREVLEPFEREVGSVHASGVPVVVVDIVRALQSDLLRMGGASLLLALLYLLAVTRSLRTTAETFAVLLATLGVTFAIFFGTGRSLTIVSANAMSLIALMGFAHALHLHVRQRELRSHHRELSATDAFLRAARELVRPCFWTVATTIAGFGSLGLAGILPVEDYGFACTLGVSLAFAFSFVLLPLGAIAFPSAAAAPTYAPSPSRARLEGLGAAAQRHRGVVLGGFAALALLAGLGVPRLAVETRFIDYFGSETRLYRDFEYLDRRMGGTMNLEIVLSARAEAPEVELSSEASLDMLGRLDAWLGARPEMGAVSSLHDFAVETAKVLPGDGGLKRTLGVLGRILGEEKLRLYRSADGKHLRVLGRVHESRSELDRRGLLRELDQELERLRPELEALGLEARATGMFLLYTNVLDSLLASQTQTALLTIGLVLAMLAIALRSLWLGAIGLLPTRSPSCSRWAAWAGSACISTSPR